MRYVALIDGEAGAYGVSFPDCPGCTAMADTLDEALASARAALAEWIADRRAAALPDPLAHSIETIRADPDVREALIEGGLLVLIPVLVDKGRPVKANLSLDSGLLEEIDAAARDRGLTRSAFVASAVRAKIIQEG